MENSFRVNPPRVPANDPFPGHPASSVTARVCIKPRLGLPLRRALYTIAALQQQRRSASSGTGCPARAAPAPSAASRRVPASTIPHMTITIKTPEEQDKMRVAGRLAAQSARHDRRARAAGRLDRRARPHLPRLHRRRARRDPGAAQLPRLVPEVDLHLGQSRRVPRHSERPRAQDGDIVNIDITVIKDGFHGDTSRMFFVGEPSIIARAARPRVLRRDVARHPRDPSGRAARRRRLRDPELRRGAALLRRARILRPRHRPNLSRRPAGPALRQAAAPASSSCPA